MALDKHVRTEQYAREDHARDQQEIIFRIRNRAGTQTDSLPLHSVAQGPEASVYHGYSVEACCSWPRIGHHCPSRPVQDEAGEH